MEELQERLAVYGDDKHSVLVISLSLVNLGTQRISTLKLFNISPLCTYETLKTLLTGHRVLCLGSFANLDLLKRVQEIRCIRFDSNFEGEGNNLGNTMPFHLYQECNNNRSGMSSATRRDLISALRKIKEKAIDLSQIEQKPKPTVSLKKKHNESETTQDKTVITENSRISKMRDIKSEIGQLMGKIDSASRQLQEAYKGGITQSSRLETESDMGQKTHSGGMVMRDITNRMNEITEPSPIKGGKQNVKILSTSQSDLLMQIQPQTSTYQGLLLNADSQSTNGMMKQHRTNSSANILQMIKTQQQAHSSSTLPMNSDRLNFEQLLTDFMGLREQLGTQQMEIAQLQGILREKDTQIQTLMYERQELALKYELEVEQLRIVNKNQKERIDAFVQQWDQEQTLELYEQHILSNEMQNKALLNELQRLVKAHAALLRAEQENDISFLDKSSKQLRTTVKKLTTQLDIAQTELGELKKQERVFALQKRCLEDTSRKANQYFNMISTLNSKLQTSETISQHYEAQSTLVQDLQQQVSELSELAQMLTEENRLLKDFTYGVDPNARILHAHRFGATEETYTRNPQLQLAAGSSVLTEKIQEFIGKYGSKRQRSSSIGRLAQVYNDDKNLLSAIKHEAAYLESQQIHTELKCYQCVHSRSIGDTIGTEEISFCSAKSWPTIRSRQISLTLPSNCIFSNRITTYMTEIDWLFGENSI